MKEINVGNSTSTTNKILVVLKDIQPIKIGLKEKDTIKINLKGII